MSSDDRVVIVTNIDADSVSVIEVRDENGNDVQNKLAEIAVGDEPRYVAIAPNDSECYVSNTAEGTVSVVLLGGSTPFTVFDDVPVGAEPRGIAVTPNGTRLYVANHTEGTVSVIDVQSLEIIGTVNVGGNPEAVAITNDGDTDDTDETVFVTQFYAELNPNGDGEVFDNGKQGVVRAFQVGNPGSPE
jgi:YVTN family beta-propeller protein